ncbi:MAG: hypothetical protein LBU11_09410 [Zoogloeaceae bacterium]|nr:hypothetical protein [Zoogloeaceae bacterium]
MTHHACPSRGGILRHGGDGYVRGNRESDCLVRAGVRAAGFCLARRALHWVVGRHVAARILYRFLPAWLRERFFAAMYIIEAEKK